MKKIGIALLALLVALATAADVTIWNQCVTLSAGTFCGSLIEQNGDPCNLHAKIVTGTTFPITILDDPIDLSVNPQVCQTFANCEICASVQNISRTADNVHGCVVVSTCLGVDQELGCFDNADMAQCFKEGCPNDCSGKGECQSDGTCKCSLGYTGYDCSQNQLSFSQCVSIQGGNACLELEFDNCAINADLTYFGIPIYQQSVPANQFDVYFGSAQCREVAQIGCSACLYWTDLTLNTTYMYGCPALNFSCQGQDYAYGLQCFADTNIVPDCFGDCPNDCSGHGTCNSAAQCECTPDYQGASCALPSCKGVNNCNNGNGQCIAPNLCQCTDGWSGSTCDTAVCNQVNQCSGQGSCVGPNVCQCNDGYIGDSCQVKSCSNQCYNGGKCDSGKCSCLSGWEGVDCTTKSSNPGSSSTGVIVGVFVAIVVVCGAVGGFYVWRRRQQNASNRYDIAVPTTDSTDDATA